MNRDYDDQIVQPKYVSFSAILIFVLMMLVVYVLSRDTIERMF